MRAITSFYWSGSGLVAVMRYSAAASELEVVWNLTLSVGSVKIIGHRLSVSLMVETYEAFIRKSFQSMTAALELDHLLLYKSRA